MTISIEPGTIVEDRYTLLEQLGEGGMGTVFRARDTLLDRIVAIKFLRPELVGDEKTFARFRREEKVLATLKHPNIITIFGCGLWSNRYPYIAMEYLTGESLREKLWNGAISVGEALNIAIHTCNALGHAHNAGIIHRDLTPANIFLERSSESYLIKVIDFGLSEFVAAAEQRLTITGELLGTVHYISPEQTTGGSIDHRCDIYSLGCVLHEMITGSPPFQADSPVGLIRLHNEQAPPALQSSSSTPLPPGLEAVVHKALAKAAANRYGSMLEFRQDLELVAAGQGSDVRQSAPASSRRKTALLLVLGLAATAIFIPIVKLRIYGNLAPGLRSSDDSVFHHLLTPAELRRRDPAQRVDYYSSWLARYGSKLSLDCAAAHFYISNELQSAALADSHRKQALSMALAVFDRGADTGTEKDVVASVNLTKQILKTAPGDTAIATFSTMIKKLESDQRKKFRGSIAECREQLVDRLTKASRYVETLQQLDSLIELASTVSRQDYYWRISRSLCLWRLGRVHEASEQLSQLYHFARTVGHGGSVELAQICFEQQQYLLCIKTCQLEAAESLQLSVLHAGSLQKMGRYREAFSAFQKRYAEWPELSSRVDIWYKMCSTNFLGKLKEEQTLASLLKRELRHLSKPLKHEQFQQLASVTALEARSALEQHLDDIYAQYVQCAALLLQNWDESDHDAASITNAQRLIDLHESTNPAEYETLLKQLLKRIPGTTANERHQQTIIHHALLRSMIQQGRNEAALALIDQLVELPEDSAFHLSTRGAYLRSRAGILRNLNRLTEAEAAANESLTLARKSHNACGEADTLLVLASLATVKGDYSKAQLLMTEAASIKPETPDDWDLVVTQQRILKTSTSLYIKMHDQNKARENINKLLQLARTSPVDLQVNGLMIASRLYQSMGEAAHCKSLEQQASELRSGQLKDTKENWFF